MKKTILIILLVAFSVTLIVSGYFILSHYMDAKKANDLYDSIAEQVADTTNTEETESGEPETEPVQYSEEKIFLPDYHSLYEQNNDMIGWIRIADTNINYPVVQSVDNPNFYLKHNFNKEYSDYGCPYVQENCDVQKPSDNLVIYGHHMKDGSMFADLEKFKSKEFWESHKTFYFDTLTDKNEYEIVAVFKTVVYTDSPDAFKYYQFVNAEEPDEFDAYIAKCKELCLYDTGVSAEYGDKLISLSTCEYSHNNGRLVVVAKRITPAIEE